VNTVSRNVAEISTSSFEQHESISIRDLISGAWAYRWSAFLLTLVLTPLMAVGVFLIPAKFDSEAQLLVRLGRGAVSIDPTANLSQTVSLQESRLAQVNSVKELLASREMLERVVKDVGAARILEPHGIVETTLSNLIALIPSSSPKSMGELSSESVASQIELEEAVKALDSALYISAPKDAYTIKLRVRTGDPFLSRDLMKSYVDHYQKFHVESHMASGSLAFFEEQATDALERATDTQAQLRDAKTSRNIVELGATKAALSSTIATIKQDLLTTESELAFANAELAKLNEQIAVLPEQIETQTTRGIPRVSGSGMRQRLYDLEVAYQELAVKFTSEHPKMVALREQLKAAAEIAQTEAGDQPQTRESINPVRQQLELAYKTTTARLAGTETKRENLQSQLDKLNEELAELNQDEVEINELAWAASLSESEYLRSATARATARQINDLDKQFLSEISVVQPATLSIKKSTPKRLILLALATAFACALGIGQALVRATIASHASLEDARGNRTLVPIREEAWGEPQRNGNADALAGDAGELIAGGHR
jgi:polysaccharide biosynthesis protein PslE